MYKYATETNSFLIRLVDLTFKYLYTGEQSTDLNHVHPQLKKAQKIKIKNNKKF
jgi:hypothetical protein